VFDKRFVIIEGGFTTRSTDALSTCLAGVTHSEPDEIGSIDIRVRAIAPFDAMHGIAQGVTRTEKNRRNSAAIYK
jgi:hypothetical protein